MEAVLSDVPEQSAGSGKYLHSSQFYLPRTEFRCSNHGSGGSNPFTLAVAKKFQVLLSLSFSQYQAIAFNGQKKVYINKIKVVSHDDR